MCAENFPKIFCVDMQLYQWKLGKREIVWKHDRSVFIQFRVFPTSTSVDITIYQYGKMFYIFFII